jgi:hypothetical protein
MAGRKRSQTAVRFHQNTPGVDLSRNIESDVRVNAFSDFASTYDRIAGLLDLLGENPQAFSPAPVGAHAALTF